MMRAKSRQRALRTLLASILNSDMSNSEIRELAMELDGGPLSRELGFALHSLADQLSHNDPHQFQTGNFDEEVESALGLVKRRKLSKVKLGQIVNGLEPSASLPRLQDVTVEEFLREFFMRASADERRHLLSILQTPSADDPYLAGIMKRLG